MELHTNLITRVNFITLLLRVLIDSKAEINKPLQRYRSSPGVKNFTESGDADEGFDI